MKLWLKVFFICLLLKPLMGLSFYAEMMTTTCMGHFETYVQNTNYDIYSELVKSGCLDNAVSSLEQTSFEVIADKPHPLAPAFLPQLAITFGARQETLTIKFENLPAQAIKPVSIFISRLLESEPVSLMEDSEDEDFPDDALAAAAEYES